MGRRKLLFFSLATVIIISFLSFSDGPPRRRTGAPDEDTCMGAPCHRGGIDFDGELQINGFPFALVAGQEFDVNVTIVATAGSPVRGGFSMVALGNENGSLVNVGEFLDPGSDAMIDDAPSGRLYLGHSPAKFFDGQDRVTYTARWRTPTSFMTDTVTLYAAAVLADGDAGSSGDHVILATKVMPVTNVGDGDGDGFNSDLDCDDTNPDINPDAMEIVNNDIDENCDGVAEMIDMDFDGFNSDVDCDDLNDQVFPGRTEIANNGIDDNCDGISLEVDEDNDGFNSDDDCDDQNPEINPDATEIVNNDVDENCDGVLEMIDEDEDGFNSDEDCNDTDPQINPDATEIPGNGIDENCDSFDGPPLLTYTGMVVDYKNDPIADVVVMDSVSGEPIDTTDADGVFTISTIDHTNTYIFFKEATTGQGLSTTDLVQITNHILDRKLFSNALQVQIADVNDSGSVSSTDLVLIKRIILQRISDFNGRPPWNFTPTVITVTTPSDTIRAFKLGDVNGSASGN